MQTLLPPDGRLYVTDGGIETTLLFHEGHALPEFAAFDLLRRPGGSQALRRYYRAYAQIARRHGAGLVLESATWRASADWGARLGYSRRELADANRGAVWLLRTIRDEHERLDGASHTLISGCVGPRGDGYQPANTMSELAARHYHREQVETLAAAGADLVSAITMNYAEEAIGITLAAREAGMPAVVSFTVETDGRLPTGEPLREAIERVDGATFGHPAYYMLNCAHPEHFEGVLARRERWTNRIRGLRANASRKSHAELNEATELDIGDPAELGRQYADIKRRLLPGLAVVGGCCGTDHRHVESMAAACAPLFAGGT
jgi:S-methylmethionine-dependent homocysteine/selenocysteine methylase